MEPGFSQLFEGFGGCQEAAVTQLRYSAPAAFLDLLFFALWPGAAPSPAPTPRGSLIASVRAVRGGSGQHPACAVVPEAALGLPG